MAVTGKLVGARVKRVEDPRYLLGSANFVSGMVLPRMVEMALVRSPHAHARIKGINTEKARQLPGVIAVITGADYRDRIRPLRSTLDENIHPSYKVPTWYAMTWDKARFVGEPVALVVASNRYVAEDAADLVEVDYEPLKPLVDPEEALKDKSSLVHEDWGDNIHCHTEYSTGDPDGVFARAHTVVKQRFRSNRHHALPLEPRGCVATFEAATGELTMWSSTQMPHMVRSKLSEHLDYPENKIRVIAPDVGGGFGLKCHFFMEEALICAVAMQFQQPIRWLEDRRESFIGSHHAKDEAIDGELALDKDGTILAARVRGIADVGAYSAFPWSSAFELLHTTEMFPGPYRMEHYAFVATSVTTNKPCLSTYRGVGAPIATWAMEGLLDLAARELNIDPVDIRRRNLIRKEEFPYTSVTHQEYEIGGYIECLEKAVGTADYAAFRKEQPELRKKGIYRGIGVCCYNEITGLGSVWFHRVGMPMSSYESANIKFDPSGYVTIWSGTHSHGQAHETVYAQIVADELSIPLDRITVRLGDTADTPYGWGTWGSRAAVSGGGAMIMAGRQLAAKIRRLAGHYLEVSANDIELVDGKAQVKGAPSRMVTLHEVAKRSIFTDASQLPPGEQPGLESTYYYDAPPTTYPNATHIAMVDVDIHTGGIKILRYIVVEDCGRIINPMVVDGQVAGGVAQGLGGAVYEHLVYDENGQALATSFMDYLIPSAADVPFIEIGHIETPTPLTPGGFKGAGEGGAIAPFGAMANAIYDALAPFDSRVDSLPLSPERVYGFAQAKAA